jgi:hypothetical protein
MSTVGGLKNISASEIADSKSRGEKKMGDNNRNAMP